MQTKLEIYKMAAEMADRVSARRMSANAFFLTVNSALITFLGFMYGQLAQDKRALLMFVSIVGLIICMAWFFAIRSYKRLNRAKYEVINLMEKDLPYKNFTNEWERLKRKTIDDDQLKGFRNWWLKFKDRYTELTNIEVIIPIVFGLLYTFIFVGALFRIIIK